MQNGCLDLNEKIVLQNVKILPAISEKDCYPPAVRHIFVHILGRTVDHFKTNFSIKTMRSSICPGLGGSVGDWFVWK